VRLIRGGYGHSDGDNKTARKGIAIIGRNVAGTGIALLLAMTCYSSLRTVLPLPLETLHSRLPGKTVWQSAF